jgi:quercetin dioxygenase-like cupin family protein
MKLLFCSALAFLSLALNSQAPTAAPIPGESHHHLKIDNEYVRAYYVEVPPHDETQLHQHDHDYVYITLGDSEVINAVVDKPEMHLALRDGETHFTRGGFAHVARNLSDKPFRNITIEVLKLQGEPHNVCERVVDGPLAGCSSDFSKLSPNSPLIALAQAMKQKRLFETDEIAMTSFSFALRQSYSESGSRPAQLLIVGDNSELQVQRSAEPSMMMHAGELLWLDAGKQWTIVTPGEQKVTQFFLIRFKDSVKTT